MARKRKRPPAHRYEPTLDALPNIAWVCDRGGELLFTNQAARTYFGVPLDDLLGWGWSGLVHPADQARMLASWSSSVETGRRFWAEYRLRRHDGVYRWFTGRGHAVSKPGQQVWFGTCADIDARMTADLGVRTTQVLFDTFVEKAGEGYVLLTVDGFVSHASHSFTSRLGLSAHELMGAELISRVTTDDRVEYAAWVSRLWDNPGRPLSIRAAFSHKDGFAVRMKATGVNLLEHSAVNGIAVCFVDEVD